MVRSVRCGIHHNFLRRQVVCGKVGTRAAKDGKLSAIQLANTNVRLKSGVLRLLWSVAKCGKEVFLSVEISVVKRPLLVIDTTVIVP